MSCSAFAEDVTQNPSPAETSLEIVVTQESFKIEPISANIYAAIAKPGSFATTNAMFIIGHDYVVAAGAHMTKEVIGDLYKAIAQHTSKPVKHFILMHHHAGYTHIDFDFPEGTDVLMSWQTWQSLDSEVRDVDFPVIFLNEGLTLKPGDSTIIINSIGKGHTEGDVVIFIPEASFVFASDLLYINSVGFMGSGFMTEWLLALDFLEQLGAKQVLPGYGPIGSSDDIYEFSNYFRDFLTAVLQRLERGEPIEEVLEDFELPEYDHMDGYQQLIKLNLKRAYEDLKGSFNLQ
ncbi:MAG: MBL fold metallo-hydrolase [Deltaproteobacteria bacterium]|nr:MBL fold metallo-hydrolase [Deltaproteobacteria bacterium]